MIRSEKQILRPSSHVHVGDYSSLVHKVSAVIQSSLNPYFNAYGGGGTSTYPISQTHGQDARATPDVIGAPTCRRWHGRSAHVRGTWGKCGVRHPASTGKSLRRTLERMQLDPAKVDFRRFRLEEQPAGLERTIAAFHHLHSVQRIRHVATVADRLDEVPLADRLFDVPGAAESKHILPAEVVGTASRFALGEFLRVPPGSQFFRWPPRSWSIWREDLIRTAIVAVEEEEIARAAVDDLVSSERIHGN